ncbi:MAG: hypothetical protein QN174_11555 [Armatimonadota bacterium]|nr:hypothetical protein [Armatimonadota bacterium]MDR7455437.1 hypothetical protein [Armatimonadota bacterium]MDR7455749.1 hypothetical protein [Armatimonadota bacterium]MDR7497579.1 hypothetical protein [Armatimonadota bacterium]MDR7512682.1 hypothetical protein [Armatimonadota bacterium]
MRTTQAYAHLLAMGRPVVTSREAAARLRVPAHVAVKILNRLARDGVTIKVSHGVWALSGAIDPWLLPEHLTAPYPSYVSTWSALYRHGMIDQIPREVYVVSLDRSKRVKTAVGTFVVQHVHPRLFGGFLIADGAKVATPEKALLDTVYLAGARGRRFMRLPELELPPRFRDGAVLTWVRRIPSRRLRTLVGDRLQSLLAGATRERRGGSLEL